MSQRDARTPEAVQAGWFLWQMHSRVAWATSVAPLLVDLRPLRHLLFRVKTPQADAITITRHFPQGSDYV
jgi:hypothetical protein